MSARYQVGRSDMEIDSKDDIFISIDDMRRFGYCGRGSREWAARHNLDWAEFVNKGGIMASELLSKGDALGQRLVDSVRARRASKESV